MDCTHRTHSERRVSQPRSAAPAGNIEVAEHISEAEASRRLWNQPPECLGRLPDVHGTLAFHPHKRLGRFVDFHVTLAFSVQGSGAGFLILMGPWLSTPKSALAGLCKKWFPPQCYEYVSRARLWHSNLSNSGSPVVAVGGWVGRVSWGFRFACQAFFDSQDP